jgi:hypothetical protein
LTIRVRHIVGPTRGGKGTIARVLEQLVGKSNFVAPTLEGLSERFALSTLLDKPVERTRDGCALIFSSAPRSRSYFFRIPTSGDSGRTALMRATALLNSMRLSEPSEI